VLLAVECKWSDSSADRSLRYLVERVSPRNSWQITATGTKDYVTHEGIRVAPAIALLKDLV